MRNGVLFRQPEPLVGAIYTIPFPKGIAQGPPQKTLNTKTSFHEKRSACLMKNHQ